MATLLQISDTHFGTERPAVLAALLALHEQLRPDVVVLSGDITQRARRGQFAAAREYLQRMAPKVLLTLPGNHDIPLFDPVARWLRPYANYSRAFGAELEPGFETEQLLVLCVNTTRRYRHKDGEVSDLQVQRVAQRLRTARPGQLRIVVTHQPVHVIRDSDVENLLHGREHAVRSWADSGVDLILGGHIHLPYLRPLSDAFADLPRRCWAVQAGTAVSSRVRSGTPNSVNVLQHLAAEGRCEVQRWDHDATARCFQLAARFPLELDRSAVSMPAMQSASQATELAQPASTSLRK